ncbi:Motile Sperm domain containing protein [Trichuris trichiura]|uniref:Major sperm protein n=1 Tax=Trichuris trichiura TaxID=36087 RepID=A0A077YXN6_TRITR|nr:Motile Sperm domain containing protein [Trichuris trichiura]
MNGTQEKRIPGNLLIEPREEFEFDDLLDEKNQWVFRLTNLGSHTLAWLTVINNWKLLDVYPPCGLLRPSESVEAYVCCEFTESVTGCRSRDHISFQWTEVDDSLTEFDRSVFDGDVIIRRQSVIIKYNF